MAVEFGISMLTDRLMPEASAARATEKLNASAAKEAQSGGGPSFQDTLKSALGDVNDALKAADAATQNFASGKAANLHEVMIAMEKADLSLRTISAVRNKVVDAYQEIMRMQV